MEENTPTFSPPPPTEPATRPWLVLGIGLVIVIVMIGVLLYSSRTSPERNTRPAAVQESATADLYAAQLEIAEVSMAEAQNGLGGTALYIEGKLKNKGDKTVTGATVEITFNNSRNQVVQRESHPVMVILRREPADDIGALNNAPLKPGESAEFRQIFERVSQDWNRNYPQLRITTVTTR